MRVKRLKEERRLYPRVDTQLPLQIAANGYKFATSTQNVSGSGAYCHIDKYIPPFTKLAIKMLLPVVSENKRKEYNIDCKGVIVRTNDEEQGGFNIAIYFNEMDQNQREKISRYINQFLP